MERKRCRHEWEETRSKADLVRVTTWYRCSKCGKTKKETDR